MWLRVPGLDPKARYRLRWAGPVAEDPEDVLREASRRDWDPLPESGPLGPDATITGAALGTIGVRIPRCHPEPTGLMEIGWLCPEIPKAPGAAGRQTGGPRPHGAFAYAIRISRCSGGRLRRLTRCTG